MGIGFAPTWLRQVSPPPASQNHFNHCSRPFLGSLGLEIRVCMSWNPYYSYPILKRHGTLSQKNNWICMTFHSVISLVIFWDKNVLFSGLNNFIDVVYKLILLNLCCCAFSLGHGVWSLGLGFETYINCLFHFLLFILVFHLHVFYYLCVEPENCG